MKLKSRSELREETCKRNKKIKMLSILLFHPVDFSVGDWPRFRAEGHRPHRDADGSLSLKGRPAGTSLLLSQTTDQFDSWSRFP